MPLLKADDLTVDFGSYRALGGVSFSIEAGERIAIVGESGAGKSLCGLGIADLLPEGARRGGKLVFDDKPVPRDERGMARLRGQRIGIILQHPQNGLNPLMSIGRQLSEAAKLNREKIQGSNEGLRLLEAVGLSRRNISRYPHQLSVADQQRLMIAMALASGPDLLIADEPTSELDALGQKVIFDLIAEVCAKRNMALILVTQSLRAAAALCSRVLVLQEGKIVETGKCETVFSNPLHEYTRGLIAAGRPRAKALARSPIGGDLLELRGVTRRFPTPGRRPFSRDEITAVNALTMSVRAVESVALIGPTGAGKTTLARIIAGLDRASEGELVFGRQTYHGSDLPPALKLDISLVLKDPFTSLDPLQKVGQAIAEPLRQLPELGQSQVRERVEEAMEAAGLPKDGNRRVRELGKVERGRVALARALVTRPRLVVLDEPVWGLNAGERADMLGFLTRLRADFSLTLLIISPDLDLVRPIADRVLIMNQGDIVEVTRPTELFTAPRHPITQALVNARLPEIG